MKIKVVIEVDVADPALMVDYNANRNSLTSEYGGNVATEEWIDVELDGIEYNGYEAELLAYEDERNLIHHIMEGLD